MNFSAYLEWHVIVSILIVLFGLVVIFVKLVKNGGRVS